MRATILATLWILGSACQTPEADRDRSEREDCVEEGRGEAGALQPIQPRFARGFSVETTGSSRQVTIAQEGDQRPLRYALVPCGGPPLAPPGVEVIEVPVRTVVTTSTTELPHLVSLGLVDRLVGHDELDYVSSPEVRERIARGEVAEVGEGARLNVEVVLDLDPDLILAASLGDAERQLWEQLRRGGISVVHVPSFLETSPLGRAEWILLTALFFGREAEAVDLFDAVAARYGALAELGRQEGERPTVLTGGPLGDVWYVPGGESFMARLVADAGGAYLWADVAASGSVPMAIEAVYERAATADVWLHPGTWTSRAQIIRADGRLAALRAWESGEVWANDARRNAVAGAGSEQGEGGNDYWETGTSRPDLVLADLLEILHPGRVPDHRLVFHRRLE